MDITTGHTYDANGLSENGLTWEQQVMADDADAAIAAEEEWEASLLETLNGGRCLLCNTAPQSKRSLCDTCYMEAYRDGSIDEYPTRAYTDDPTNHARWVLQYHPELFLDLAPKYGYKVEKQIGWVPPTRFGS